MNFVVNGRIKEVMEVMGMLKSISLENYKCFKDKTDINVAPLTVLCGVNSSGKSSILKSLLMLKQSYENTLSFNELTFNGKYVDNGFFQSIVNNKSGEYFILQNVFEITKPPSRNEKGISEPDATTFNELLKIFKQFEYITHSKISCFKVEISLTIQGCLDTNDVLRKIKNTISEYNIKISLLTDQNGVLESITDKKIRIMLCKTSSGNRGRRTYDLQIDNIPYDINNTTSIFNGSIPSCSCYFEGVKLVKLYKSNPSIENISLILPNLYAIFRIVSYQYKNIKHISPLRNLPTRRYIFDENVNSAGNGGEFTTQALYAFRQKPIVFVKPPKNDLLDLNASVKCNLMTAVQNWAEYLGIGELNIELYEEMLKLNISDSNIVDVGFGISQGLPVIVSGLLLNKHETLLLEQPEIHLHPNMQMKMADFLLTQAYSGKNIIVETHSDHFINRITRRVMEDKTGILQKFIKIYFVQGNNPECPIYSDIKIDPIDGLVDAPIDFFTQFGSELMHITKIGMLNAKEGVKW